MIKPIRILHVLGRLDRGGAETMIMNLYRNINRSQIQFDFVIHTNDQCEFNEEILGLGGKIYNIIRYNGKNHFAYKRAWETLLTAHPEYRLIHGHMRSTASIYLKIAKRYGLTTIAHSHSTASRGNKIEQLVKNLMQIPIRYIADYKFACSLDAGRWLFGNKIELKNNFYLIKNAINIKKFTFDKKTRDLIRNKYNLDDKFVLGHVGNFTAPKNHNFLLDLFVEVQKTKKNTALLLIGDGELKKQIQEKALKLGISSKVIIIKAENNVNEFLQAMDIFLFPSYFEGLGIAAIEAQAAGLPCIISNKVPEEVILTNLVVRLPLQSIEDWNAVIFNTNLSNRKNTSNLIRQQGYDIIDQANKMKSLYFQMLNTH